MIPLLLPLLLLPFQVPGDEALVELLKELELPNPNLAAAARAKVEAQGSEMVPFLQRELEGKDRARRRRAARAASILGKKAEPLVAQLSAQLGESNRALVGFSIASLGVIGPSAAEAMPGLAKALDSGDEEIRRIALVARSRIRPDGKGLRKEQLRGLEDGMPPVRRAAMLLLFRRSDLDVEILRALLGQTQDPHPELRKEAQKEFAEGGKPLRALVLAEAKGGEPLHRSRALMVLGVYAPLEAEETKLLLDELEDRAQNQAARTGLLLAGSSVFEAVRPRFEARLAASPSPEVLDRWLFYIGGLAEVGRPLADMLLPLLDHSDAGIRERVLILYRGMKVEDARVLERLRAIARGEDRQSAVLSIEALGRTRAAGPETLELLLDLLEKGPDFSRKHSASAALSWLGAKTLSYQARLFAMLESEDEVTRLWTRSTLGHLGLGVMPGLAKRWPTAGHALRIEYLRVCAEMKDGAPVAFLRERLADKEAELRLEAVLALGRQGEAGHKAIADLLALLEDPEAQVRLGAVTALGQLGRGDRRLVGPLSGKARGEDPWMARSATMALARLGLPETLEVLRGLLAHGDPQVRWRACFGLGELGTAAQSAEEDLRKALNDAEAIVRDQAQKALLRVRPRR